MKSVKWGPLYNQYKNASLDPTKLEQRVVTLMADLDVKNKRGIYEFLLGGEAETKLLDVRVFDEKTKLAAYGQQTKAAGAAGTSNCPKCASGTNNNTDRIYEMGEMDADHVTAWSNGGASDLANCEMLCVHHNRSKGNRVVSAPRSSGNPDDVVAHGCGEQIILHGMVPRQISGLVDMVKPV